jgi:hypothetical protein
MGVSSDGLLVFGFPIGEEDEMPEFLGDCDDMDDFIAGPWKSGGDHKARQALIDACPADLTVYCSYDYSMYVLAVRGTEARAARGDAVEISPEHLAVAPEKIAAFQAWCEENGIEYHEPKWLLCSMYG